MIRQAVFTREEILHCGRGEMFGPGNLKLPLPDMLMIDRITHISEQGGSYGCGEVMGEMDLHPGLWFFPCHFQGDPVMPGCLMLDALWQLLGFFDAWCGHPGKGRAFGVGEVKFKEQVLPSDQQLHYRLDIKRLMTGRLVLGIADGTVTVDGRVACVAKDLRVGLVNG